MTVAELITKLQAMPMDARVVSWEGDIGDWVEVIECIKEANNTVQLETQYDTTD